MRRQIDSLTSLRFFAAFAVVLFHYRDSFGPHFDFGLAANVVGRGYIWVDFFFVLSGFVIAYVYDEEFKTFEWRRYGHFLLNRVARIYPAHAFVVLLFLAWEGATYVLVKLYGFSAIPFGECMTPTTFVLNMTMLHAWGIDDCSWNYPAWSISSEWLAYLAFPVTLVVLRWARSAGSALAAAALVYGGLVAASAVQANYAVIGIGATQRVLFEFAIGIAVFRLHAHGHGRAVEGWAGTMAAASFAAAVACLHLGVRDVFIIPLFALTIYSSAKAERGVWNRVLGLPWLVFLGEASYSIYLIHGFDQRLWGSLYVRVLGINPPAQTALVMFVAVMAGIVVSGIGVYLIVERPARRAIRAWHRRWR